MATDTQRLYEKLPGSTTREMRLKSEYSGLDLPKVLSRRQY